MNKAGTSTSRMREKNNKKRNHRTVSKGGEIHEGSLRAQKILKDESKDALEQTLIIIGSVLRGFTQQRYVKALNRARFPFEICPRTETSTGK